MANYNEIQLFNEVIKDIDTRLKALETSGRLFASGIGAGGINIHDAGKLTVRDGGSIHIDGGNLDVYGTAADPAQINVASGGEVVADGPVQFTGNSSFGGAVRITGTLSITGNVILRNGIINAAALRNQMSSNSGTQNASGFAIWNTWNERAVINLSVPSWATTSVVYASATAMSEWIQDFNANIDWDSSNVSWMKIRIGSSESNANNLIQIPYSQGWNSGYLGYSSTITNPGSTIGVGISMRADNYEWYPASPNNIVGLQAMAIHYR